MYMACKSYWCARVFWREYTSVLFCDWTGICCRMLSTSPTSGLKGEGRERKGEGTRNKREEPRNDLPLLNHVLAPKLMDTFNHCEPLTDICVHNIFLLIRLH